MPRCTKGRILQHCTSAEPTLPRPLSPPSVCGSVFTLFQKSCPSNAASQSSGDVFFMYSESLNVREQPAKGSQKVHQETSRGKEKLLQPRDFPSRPAKKNALHIFFCQRYFSAQQHWATPWGKKPHCQLSSLGA